MARRCGRPRGNWRRRREREHGRRCGSRGPGWERRRRNRWCGRYHRSGRRPAGRVPHGSDARSIVYDGRRLLRGDEHRRLLRADPAHRLAHDGTDALHEPRTAVPGDLAGVHLRDAADDSRRRFHDQERDGGGRDLPPGGLHDLRARLWWSVRRRATCFSCQISGGQFAACTTPCTDVAAGSDCSNASLPRCQMGQSGNVDGTYCTAANVMCDCGRHRPCRTARVWSADRISRASRCGTRHSARISARVSTFRARASVRTAPVANRSAPQYGAHCSGFALEGGLLCSLNG